MSLLVHSNLFIGTIFAYGQTGTGKTYTMEGVRAVPELRGIIPNSFAHIFGHIAKAEDDTRYNASDSQICDELFFLQTSCSAVNNPDQGFHLISLLKNMVLMFSFAEASGHILKDA